MGVDKFTIATAADGGAFVSAADPNLRIHFKGTIERNLRADFLRTVFQQSRISTCSTRFPVTHNHRQPISPLESPPSVPEG